MPREKKTSIGIVKIAAMGDVALACRALTDFGARFDTRALEMHWVIDEALQPLAAALLSAAETPLVVRWHKISAKRLFQGSLGEKLAEALKIVAAAMKTHWRVAVLLHRDWRYRAFLAAVPGLRSIAIGRSKTHELEIYAQALETLGAKLRLPAKASETPVRNKPASGGSVGILVGGAQNAKVQFLEKRWPRIEEFAHALLANTSKRLELFGGPEDRDTAERLVTTLKAAGVDASRVTNHAGKLPLSELPAKLAALGAFVSIDSGLAHIASFVMRESGQKSITLFGPTSPQTWAPKANGQAQAIAVYHGVSCSPCYHNDGNFRKCAYGGAKFQHCMSGISAKEVLELL